LDYGEKLWGRADSGAGRLEVLVLGEEGEVG